VAETFKVTNVNTVEETIQPIDKNEQTEESRSLENPHTTENPELDKLKNRILQGTKRI
jgi:hypothetical protein